MATGHFEFSCGTRVVFGSGRLDELGHEARSLGARCTLVTYRDLGALEPTVERARRTLREAGLEVVEFLEAVPDPAVRLAVEGGERAKADGVDVVAGVGGGSALDLAKAVAFMATNPGKPFDYMMCNPERRQGVPALPCVAVPTTSGTGSEVSRGSVLTVNVVDAVDAADGTGAQSIKGTIIDPGIAPRVAIVDPELTADMPPGLTAATGADALGHAIEAALSNSGTPMSRCFGADSTAIIFRSLKRAVDSGADSGGGGDIEARSDMAWAATLSGLAIASGGTIATHAMSHAAGSMLHVPHGVAVAALTVPVLEYCTDAAAGEFARLARAAGLGSGRDSARAFVEATAGLLSSADLPSVLTVEGEAWSDDLPAALARNAWESAPFAVRNTPREMGEAEMAEVFRRVVQPEAWSA